MQGLYLIHFNEPYKHARHYLGGSQDIAYRIQRHLQNRGAALLTHLNRVGITWRVVRIWPTCDSTHDIYELEKKLKARHDSPSLCPICNPNVQVDEEFITQAITWKP